MSAHKQGAGDRLAAAAAADFLFWSVHAFNTCLSFVCAGADLVRQHSVKTWSQDCVLFAWLQRHMYGALCMHF